MDKKIKSLDLKQFQNVELYKNDYNSVGNISVSHKNKNHTISYFREPYTHDMVAVVLPYKHTPDGIKVLYQKRILPFWNGTSDEADIAIFAPCTEEGKLMTDVVAAEVERKTGYDVKDKLEYKGSFNIYPKLATKAFLFFVDITHKVRVHDPLVHIEEVYLNDEHFEAAEPLLHIMIEKLRIETTPKIEPVEKPTFLEEHKTQVLMFIGATTGFAGIQILLGIASLLKGLLG